MMSFKKLWQRQGQVHDVYREQRTKDGVQCMMSTNTNEKDRVQCIMSAETMKKLDVSQNDSKKT